MSDQLSYHSRTSNSLQRYVKKRAAREMAEKQALENQNSNTQLSPLLKLPSIASPSLKTAFSIASSSRFSPSIIKQLVSLNISF